ncbi:MAG: zinc-binding dehydrogenase, partial [Chloroflexota bacterium]
NQQICDNDFQPGFHGPGSFAEYVALPHADLNLVRVPEAMSFVDVASLGCRFVTAYRALVAQAKVNAGEWVVIHGCGGVGLSAVMIAASAGAQVIAVDINEDALQLAAAVGATHLIDASETTEQELIDLTHDLSDGGAHVAMDALGSRITLRNSILSLRKRGRHVQVGLFGGDEADPAVPMGAVISKELEIYGSHGMQAHAYPPMLRQIASGTLK